MREDSLVSSKEVVVIGVDTGGTFTDFLYIDGGRIKGYKCLSTPHNPALAVLQGLKVISPEGGKNIVHGSTVATNAILERKGARTALITNEGFEDVIEIGRQNRFALYDLRYEKPYPLVHESMRFGIKGRVLYSGEVHQEADEDEIRKVVARAYRMGAESVAISLLFSYVNPVHEKIVAKCCEAEGLAHSTSHLILPEFREYERTSTTVLNAYVSPTMNRYISFLSSNLGRENSFRVMQSNGGSISSTRAVEEPIRTVLSGPAGGVVGAWEIGKISGFNRLITFDMGGTSTDVSLVDGEPTLTTESLISGWSLRVPMIDIHTVGAGGGSIARIDSGGSLRVGPESAGADPGPICYGRGDRITVTDANLYLGRLLPDHFLGGEMSLTNEGLEREFQDLAKKAGLDPLELAEGIVDVANTTMEKAIRVISLEKGFDPRDFTLCSFGGAGGLHAPYLAEYLSIPRVIVPGNPGLLSAFGMLQADVVKDYSLTVMLREDDVSPGEIEALFLPLAGRGTSELMDEGILEEDIILQRFLDMRYEGQSHEIMVPFSEACVNTFHCQHERMYGYKNPELKVELVNIRLIAKGIPEKPDIIPEVKRCPVLSPEADLGKREIVFDSSPHMSDVLDREKLLPGNRVEGPALIVEYSSTTVVPHAWTMEVDGFRNLILTREVGHGG